MNNNITFTPSKVWISDNKVVPLEGCIIEEFITPLSDKAELDATIKLSSVGNIEFTSKDVQMNMALFDSMSETLKTPTRIYWDIPIMIQARCHKKYRVNKKWLKRYGMKRDVVAAEATVKSFTSTPGYAVPTDIVYCDLDTRDFECDIDKLTLKYKPHQIRKNSRVEFLR